MSLSVSTPPAATKLICDSGETTSGENTSPSETGSSMLKERVAVLLWPFVLTAVTSISYVPTLSGVK